MPPLEMPRLRTTLSIRPETPRASRTRQPIHRDATRRRRSTRCPVSRNNAIGAAIPITNISATTMVKIQAPRLEGLPGSGLGASPKPTLPPRYQYACIAVNRTAHVSAHHKARAGRRVPTRTAASCSGSFILVNYRFRIAPGWPDTKGRTSAANRLVPGKPASARFARSVTIAALASRDV